MATPHATRKPSDVQPGETIGHLKIIAVFTGIRGRTRFCYLCGCGRDGTTCGHQVLKSLASGRYPSCGCQRRSNLRHGEARLGLHTPEWMTWSGMMRRCTNPRDKHYKDYGGRGVAVCERWRTYENFLADMGRRPTPKHSIDRIDNDKGYEPGNCEWASAMRQAQNRRTVVWIEHNGERRCAADWARTTGIRRSTILARFHKDWSPDRVLAPVAS